MKFAFIIRRLFLLLIFSGLIGCTFQSFVIKRLDYFATREADSAFDFDHEQKRLFREATRKTIVWFQQFQLPGLMRYLDQVEMNFNREMTETEMNEFFERVYAVRTAIVEQLGFSLEPEVRKLTGENLKSFEKYINKSIEEWKELMQSHNFEKDRFKKLRKTIERWFGSINDEQMKEVMIIFPADRLNLSRWIQEKERANRTIIEYLEDKKLNGGAFKMFAAWSAKPETLQPNAVFIEEARSRRINNQLNLMKLFNLMNPSQKLHAMNQLRSVLVDVAAWTP